MLKLIGGAFKVIFSVIIVIALIIVVIVGFTVINNDSPKLGFLILIGGLILIILSAGLVSIFINIGETLIEIKSLLEKTNVVKNNYALQNQNTFMPSTKCRAKRVINVLEIPNSGSNFIFKIEEGEFVTFLEKGENTSETNYWCYIENDKGSKGWCASVHLEQK